MGNEHDVAVVCWTEKAARRMNKKKTKLTHKRERSSSPPEIFFAFYSELNLCTTKNDGRTTTMWNRGFSNVFLSLLGLSKKK